LHPRTKHDLTGLEQSWIGKTQFLCTRDGYHKFTGNSSHFHCDRPEWRIRSQPVPFDGLSSDTVENLHDDAAFLQTDVEAPDARPLCVLGDAVDKTDCAQIRGHGLHTDHHAEVAVRPDPRTVLEYSHNWLIQRADTYHATFGNS
jgi:hypothetical protein